MNPFPGMNPYLEQSRFWRGFHNKFIALLEDKLNEILPPGFAANSEERIKTICTISPFLSGPNISIFCLYNDRRGDRKEIGDIFVTAIYAKMLKMARNLIVHTVFSIPLLENVEEPKIDLQQIIDRLYQKGAYSPLINYNKPPYVPYTIDEAAWMDTLLREKGLRT